MNKEHIINEAYENYSKEYEKDNSIGMCLLVKRLDGKSTYRKPNKEMFVDLCTYDKTFSEKWGLKIEERELSLEERSFIAGSNHNEVSQNIKMFTGIDEDHTLHKHLDDINIPNKLITITYNDKTIESYE
jgi:hypothetical protein